MLTDTIYIIGAGGHAKVVVDALLLCGTDPARIRITDARAELAGTNLLGLPIQAPAVTASMRGAWFHVAIGAAKVRRVLHAELMELGVRPLSVIHPRATVSPFAKLGQAVFVAANAVVGPDARLGDAVIVNHGAVVDHDCEVEAFSHIAPNSTLAGAAHVGASVLIGAGANLLTSLHVGDEAVIGAGAVVLNNVHAAHTCVGVPAVSKIRKTMKNIRDISVTRSTTVNEALAILEKTGSGILLLVNDDGSFSRTITDGDLRRLLLNGRNFNESLSDLPEIASIVVEAGYSRRDALGIMNEHSINHLPVLDEKRHVAEVLERRDIDRQILLSTPHLGEAEQDFVQDAFRTNWVAPLGPNVDAFERELADYVGVKHAAAVSSGTAAIHLALLLLGVTRGDTVFCSSLTFSASANPIVYQGAEPVFIDSDRLSWNMSPVALERALEAAKASGRLPKAVIVVSLYGQSADMDPLVELCERYGVPLIEDAAESLGARYKGRASGTFGRMGIYSFNGNKIITTSGGGMLVSNDAALIERAKFLATQARDPAPHYQHSVIGYNYRMSNILAGVGRGQLGVLEDRVAVRRSIFDRYRRGLAHIQGITWMPEPDWSISTHWLSACTINPDMSGITSEGLIRKLATEMIEARPVWKPMHLQPVFSSCQYFTAGDESVSDDLFAKGVCLPSGSNMKDSDIDRVIEQIDRAMSA